MVLITPFIAYFPKKIIAKGKLFKKFEGLREVSHISPNWWLFALVEVGTQLGESVMKEEGLLEARRGPNTRLDAGLDSQLTASGQYFC
jgi:hypothetical protein